MNTKKELENLILSGDLLIQGLDRICNSQQHYNDRIGMDLERACYDLFKALNDVKAVKEELV